MENQLRNFLKALKLNESTVSMILGLVVVVVVGGLLVNYFRLKPSKLPTISDADVASQSADVANQEQYANTPADQLPPFEGELPAKYRVRAGDNLWKIAERYYKTGYAWSEVAQANNLTETAELTTGQELTIPQLAKAYPQTVVETNPAIGGDSTDSAEVQPTPEATATVAPTPTPEPEPTSTPEPTATIEPTAQPTQAAAEVISSPEVAPETISGDTYTVVKGDNLWNIAQRAYGDGYKWTEIAKANNLLNPSLIHSGNQLTLPR